MGLSSIYFLVHEDHKRASTASAVNTMEVTSANEIAPFCQFSDKYNLENREQLWRSLKYELIYW
jgi:hypothetical protein